MLRICSATTPTLPSPIAVVSHCGAAEGAVLAVRTGQAGVEASCRLAQCIYCAGQSSTLLSPAAKQQRQAQ